MGDELALSRARFTGRQQAKTTDGGQHLVGRGDEATGRGCPVAVDGPREPLI